MTTLNGDAGSDRLVGGAGNDTLNGGHYEADTYVFEKGHGKDVVSEYGSQTEHTDTLRLKEPSLPMRCSTVPETI